MRVLCPKRDRAHRVEALAHPLAVGRRMPATSSDARFDTSVRQRGHAAVLHVGSLAAVAKGAQKGAVGHRCSSA